MSEHDSHQNPQSPLPPDAPAMLPLPRLPRPPFWMIAIGLVSVVASWLPLVVAGVARTGRSSSPRISLIQDMGMQPKYREQQTNPLFADGRAMRPTVPGTVSRTDLDGGDHYRLGFHLVHNPTTNKDEATFYRGFPDEAALTDDLVQRGQGRFVIYCSPCHGMDGSGHGSVNEDALHLMDAGATGMAWTQAANLHDAAVMSREEGNLFNTITNGVRNMPGYAGQIPIHDRWAIVAYVRALQLSQATPKSILSAEQQNQMGTK